MKVLFLVLSLVSGLSSCSSSFEQPFAQVQGVTVNTIENKDYDVLITKLDGVQFINEKTLLTLTPGIHQLRVQSTKNDPTPGNRQQRAYADFTLDAKPCIKYYLSAYHPNQLSLEMEIQITKEKPIEQCNALKTSDDA